jgi:WD40 repeat protein
MAESRSSERSFFRPIATRLARLRWQPREPNGDGGLLRAAAASGQTEWPRPRSQSQPLETFTADDWTTKVQGLVHAGDGAELWRWALLAPPEQARTLLQAIPMGAAPPPHLGKGAGALLRLARDLPAAGEGPEDVPWGVSHTLQGHSQWLRSLAWSPNGTFLASAGDDEIRLWTIDGGACIHILRGHSDSVRALAWSPDGSCLASASWDRTIQLWDPASGACTRRLLGHSHAVQSIAWSPDGRCLASMDHGKRIRLWNPASGACTRHRTLKGHSVEGIDQLSLRLAWLGDGRCLAAAIKHQNIYRSNTVLLWDVGSGQCLHALKGHQDPIMSLAWSPDGSRLASECHHNTRIWDPLSGACLQTLEGPHGRVSWWPNGTSVFFTGAPVHAFAPNGRCLARSGDEHKIIVMKNGLDILLSTPLACFERQHWEMLVKCASHTSSAEAWAAPWLTFLSALGTLIRRFDVGVEETTPQQQESPYAVMIDV